MPVRQVTEYLDTHQADYHAYNHPPAVTAKAVARSAHIPAAKLAKTVIVSGDDELAMAVLPAECKIDEIRLRDLMQVRELRIAHEYEFENRFPLCEVGGMPPLGGLYDMPVYMERSLLNHDWIAFNAGSHTEVIKMDSGVYRRIVQPNVCSFALGH